MAKRDLMMNNLGSKATDTRFDYHTPLSIAMNNLGSKVGGTSGTGGLEVTGSSTAAEPDVVATPKNDVYEGSVYDRTYLTQDELDTIQGYRRAVAEGTMSLEDANAQAEMIRAKYGYSGGQDGSGYYKLYTDDTAAPSAPVDSYLAYLEKQAGYLGTSYQNQLDKIDQENEDLLRQIETKRRRAVADARSSYELNKATYGTDAERLAQMGLTGSGYSDHLESRAYAASRGEVQAANASALAAENEANLNATNQKLAAGVTYQNGLRESEAQRAAYIESKFDSLNTGAATGVYSQEQLNAYADYYGFDDSKRDVLTSSANAYQTALAKQETENNKANVSESYANRMNFIANINIDATAYSEEDIEQAVTADVLTRDDADYVKGYIKTAQQNEAKSTISTAIASGNYDGAAEAIEDAREIIGDDACQSAYFDIVLAKCKAVSTADDASRVLDELKYLAGQGKISSKDFETGKQYLGDWILTIPSETIQIQDISAIANDEIYDLTIGGVRRKVKLKSLSNQNVASMLDDIVNNKIKGSTVKLGEERYLYMNNTWYRITENKKKDFEEFCEAYEKACSYQPKPTVPKHQSS